MDLLKTFGPLIGSVAPTIATALGGPVAGMAVKAISGALFGHDSATEDEIRTVLANPTGDQLAALKKIDADFKVQMKSLDIDLERIAAGDRASARDMQKETKDWIPRALAVSVTVGFFAILLYMLVYGLPTTGNEALLLLLGALQTAWGGIIAFYFGSSSGSQKKDQMIYNSKPLEQIVQDNFEQCLALVLKHEGGFVNHPKDPGGMTNLGVTKRVWEEWVGHPVDEAAMRALGPQDVAPLYKKNYWDKIRGDDLPSGVDYACFDLAVNSGVGRAAKFLQQAVGVSADGVIGPATLDAVEKANPRDLATEICDLRLNFLQSLPTFATFGKGWSRRVSEVEESAFKMVG